MTTAEKRLLKLFRQLDQERQNSLLDFADYLRERVAASEPETPTEPLDIPRPEEESVIRAMKRLTATYPMLDTKSLFNEASSLMNQHLLKGRAAIEVIDDLEELFRARFEQL